MSFPLAHPAAVLPLKRYWPQVLSLPALVIGSLVPDAGYLLARWNVQEISHQFLGSVGFCLPAGLAVLGLFYLLRTPVVEALPAGYRQALLPSCRRPIGPFWRLALSLLLGIWTHLLWDSLTHKDGGLVQQWSVLAMPIMSIGNHTARVCHLLEYGSSFVGVFCLVLAFEKWRRSCVARAPGASGDSILRDAAVAAIVVLPLHLVYQLVPGGLGLLLCAGLCVLLIAGFALKVGRAAY
jgi:hypothetical protein